MNRNQDSSPIQNLAHSIFHENCFFVNKKDFLYSRKFIRNISRISYLAKLYLSKFYPIKVIITINFLGNNLILQMTRTRKKSEIFLVLLLILTLEQVSSQQNGGKSIVFFFIFLHNIKSDFGWLEYSKI